MRPGTVRRWFAGVLLACGVSVAAERARALDRSGAVAATALGAVIFAAGGLGWTLPLLAFFVPASAVSRIARERKAQLLGEPELARSARTARQVLANGGLAGLAGLAQVLGWYRPQATVLYAGVLATASADTWATELGLLSPYPPRSLRTGRPVAPGTSGAVSPLGLLAAFLGAGLVAATAPVDTPSRRLSVWLAGVTGSLVDSLLGSLLQARFQCPRCGLLSEVPRKHCGCTPVRVAGLPGMTNDTVNALATLSGALFALVLSRADAGTPRVARSGARGRSGCRAVCSDVLRRHGDTGPS